MFAPSEYHKCINIFVQNIDINRSQVVYNNKDAGMILIILVYNLFENWKLSMSQFKYDNYEDDFDDNEHKSEHEQIEEKKTSPVSVQVISQEKQK